MNSSSQENPSPLKYKRYLGADCNINKMRNSEKRRKGLMAEGELMKDDVWINLHSNIDANPNGYINEDSSADDTSNCLNEQHLELVNNSVDRRYRVDEQEDDLLEMNTVDEPATILNSNNIVHAETSVETSLLVDSIHDESMADNIVESQREEQNDTINVNLNDKINGFQKLQNFLTTYNNTTLCSSIKANEVLLTALTFIERNNPSLTASTELFQALNIILSTDIFPNTNYKVKELISPYKCLEFHCVCSNCGDYLGKKSNQKSIICGNCELVNNVAGYQYNNAFVTVDISDQIQFLAKKYLSSSDVDMREKLPQIEKDKYTDISSGSMYAKTMSNQTFAISAEWNSDGVKLLDGPQSSVTPFSFLINELPVSVRGKNILVPAISYGYVKPRTEVVLHEVVKRFNILSKDGIPVELKSGETVLLKVYFPCCCVDSKERNNLQGITSTGGYHCCSWCTIHGTYVGDAVKYLPSEPFILRTDELHRADCEHLVSTGESVNGVISVSPLLELKYFDIILGFVNDGMHSVILGIDKRLLDCWLNDSDEPYYIGTPAKINILNARISQICVPRLMKKHPLPISLAKQMKARDLENLMTYFFYPIFLGILPTKYFNHFLLLVNAICILFMDEILEADLIRADDLINTFIDETPALYGQKECTYNMHILRDLVPSVRQWGPLWAHTAYPFEASFSTLRRIVVACKGIPHQIVRQLHIKFSLNILKEYVVTENESIKFYCGVNSQEKRTSCQNDEIVYGEGTLYTDIFNIGPARLFSYNKLVRNNVLYSTVGAQYNTRNDDTLLLLKNGEFARLQLILVTEENPHKAYAVINPIKTTRVPNMLYLKFATDSESDATLIEFVDVKAIALHLNPEGQSYVCPLPQSHFVLNM